MAQEKQAGRMVGTVVFWALILGVVAWAVQRPRRPTKPGVKTVEDMTLEELNIELDALATKLDRPIPRFATTPTKEDLVPIVKQWREDVKAMGEGEYEAFCGC